MDTFVKKPNKKSGFKELKADFEDIFSKNRGMKKNSKQKNLDKDFVKLGLQRRASDGTNFNRNIIPRREEQHPRAIHSVRRVRSYTKPRLVPVKQPESVIKICEKIAEERFDQCNRRTTIDKDKLKPDVNTGKNDEASDSSILSDSALVSDLSIRSKSSSIETSKSVEDKQERIADSGKESGNFKVLQKSIKTKRSKKTDYKVSLSEAANQLISMSKNRSNVTSSSSGISTNSYGNF